MPRSLCMGGRRGTETGSLRGKPVRPPASSLKIFARCLKSSGPATPTWSSSGTTRSGTSVLPSPTAAVRATPTALIRSSSVRAAA